jgi:hypothetical protein
MEVLMEALCMVSKDMGYRGSAGPLAFPPSWANLDQSLAKPVLHSASLPLSGLA